jgi:DNA-binding transcriptional LysR family regulator
MLMDVEIRHLRSFLVIAEELNFTRAAVRLQVSQPSLTRTINGLERMIGVRLLHRTTRHVSLTHDGEALRVEAERLVRDFDRVLESRAGATPLRLGFTWLLPDTWAQQVIPQFERQRGVRVELLRRDEAFAGIDRGEVDVAVLRGNRLPPGMLSVRLFRERRVVAVRRGSPLAERAAVQWRDLVDHPLVINVVSGTTQLDQWPEGSRPEAAIRCENFDEWLEAVAADRGVGVVPVSAAYRTAHPAIRFVPLEGAPLVPVRLVYPRQGAHPLAAQFARASRLVAIPPHAVPPEAVK